MKLPKHRVPRPKQDIGRTKGRTFVASDDRGSDEDQSLRVLPHLVQTPQKQHPSEFATATEPQWMSRQTYAAVTLKSSINKTGGALGKRKPHIARSEAPHKLSLLDEQMLILCRSAIERSWGTRRQLQQLQQHQDPAASSSPSLGHESIYAATQVQRLFRGFKTRRRLAEFDGPLFQRAASHIQFALRRVAVARRVFQRWMGKRHRCATRIQVWYRGCRARDQIQYDRARLVIHRVALLQRRYRGYRFWNLVAALLARRRNNAATHVQRCYRGLSARRRVRRLREQRMRFARELQSASDLHRCQSRCDGCRDDCYSEASLFACFMVRFVGLHDLAGAKTLGIEGVRTFPTSARFCFMYSVLLQATGENLDTSMAFLRRAQLALQLNEADIAECETRYFLPALQLCKDDIAVLVNLAIISQCLGKTTRAESFYRHALRQPPVDYAIPGYLHRVDMMDRVLLNYHRFCSVFQSRQANILAKVISIAKRGEQVRVMVARLNQMTVIYPAEEAGTCRFNAVYLTDNEVTNLLADKKVGDDEDADSKPVGGGGGGGGGGDSVTDLDPGSWRRSSKRDSARNSFGARPSSTENTRKADAASARKHVLTQLHQNEFRGLECKLTKLSRPSELRSRLVVTREHAERLLRELSFVDPLVDPEQERSVLLHRIVLVPPVLKIRMLRAREIRLSHAILHAQRVFRGFRVRARIRREQLLQSIHQRQVDELYAKLHQNFIVRETRRLAAIGIQRIYKGFTVRKLLQKWQLASVEIQRIVRGHRGRKRAVAFRDGNLTFYMAERVFQRGVSISGKSVVLLIEKCGLSFRMEAYDMVACCVYSGFVTHESTMALLRYANWSAAQALCGHHVLLHGTKATVDAVAFINRDDGQCVMSCSFLKNDKSFSAQPEQRLVTLLDCIQAINLRNAGTKGKETELLPLPLTGSDTTRIVANLVERLTLVPAIPTATKELKKKTPGGFILAVQPPPRVHYSFHKTGSVVLQVAAPGHTATETRIPIALARLVAFPVVADGYRGVSVGKQQFRKKCTRHSVHFSKCRCVLPLVTTPAYVEALTLALSPPLPPAPPPTPLVPSSHPTH